jgi:hypothetical protein
MANGTIGTIPEAARRNLNVENGRIVRSIQVYFPNQAQIVKAQYILWQLIDSLPANTFLTVASGTSLIGSYLINRLYGTYYFVKLVEFSFTEGGPLIYLSQRFRVYLGQTSPDNDPRVILCLLLKFFNDVKRPIGTIAG